MAAHYNKGRALHDLQRYEEAKPELETAWRLAPSSSSALSLLALIERQMNNNERAIDLLQKLVAMEPKNAEAHFQLGQSYLRAGRTTDATRLWKETLEIDPEHGGALYSLLRSLDRTDPQQAGIYKERYAAFQKKREITDRAEALSNFALASARNRDWPQAIAQLQEALQTCRDCRSLSTLHKNLGLIYCHSGDLKSGERELRLALELKSDDADTLKSLRIIEAVRSVQKD